MTQITIEATIQAPIAKVWEYWIGPKHITKWNSASPDWHSPRAKNDVRVGGTFNIRMEAKDGSAGFDFEGTYDEVILHEKILYHMSDGRKVEVLFSKIHDNETLVTETFDAEETNPVEMQQQGWQAILDSFKHYVEKAN